VIHLDTNVLIGLADADSTVLRTVGRWLDAGETLAVSSIAWFEFSCGPLDEDSLNLIEVVIAGRIVRFNATQAVRAAALFNSGGRQRASRWDCMIAAAAIESRAQLATFNAADFARFKKEGLDLVTV
jgi:predicted nucleic acid-binding protein